ncbi:MAG: hypothetical protein AAB508_04085 [Patescibacteria group bacterium]
MKKLFLSMLLLLVFILIVGSFSVAHAQEEGRSVTMTSMDGEDITMWTSDSDACMEIRGENSKCQDISDACVKAGGCYPMLVTLTIMGCKKCDEAAKSCYAAVSAREKDCVKSAVLKYKKEDSAPSKAPEDSETPESSIDEAVCHESCQSTYDVCTQECKTTEIFSNDSGDCQNKCDAVYDSAYKNISSSCFKKDLDCRLAIVNRDECKGLLNGACDVEIRERCTIPYDECLQPAKDAGRTCLDACTSGIGMKATADTCFNSCEQTQSSCSARCREAALVNTVNKPPKKPSVGVSSRDFKFLAQMHNQLQYAQAQLDQVKASGDPRLQAKQDSSSTRDDDGESLLDKIKEKLDHTKDAASVALDAKELYDFLTQGKFGSYSGVSFTADVGNGIITFTELVGKGVSIKNATTKATIDAAAPSLFIIFPPLKVADMITTMPDTFMSALGVSKNDPLRQVTNFMKESSAPSSFVQQTTTAMVTTQNWSNMDTILQSTLDDFQSAEGFGEKLVEGFNIIGVAIGAIPVAIALQINDAVSVNISIGESVVNLVSSLFTFYPY